MAGGLWALAFVLLESVQFVFFGSVFQRVSSVQFGCFVFALTTLAFIGWAALRRPAELRTALAQPRLLFAINAAATLSWLMLLMAVQIIEPAIAYTIGAGAMPLAAWAAHRLGVAGGDAPRSRSERHGVTLIGLAVGYLCFASILGWSGFVRGGPAIAALGVTLAFAEGALFTWLLILCQRLDRKGVTPSVVFGLRFPLYVVTAGVLAAAGLDQKPLLPLAEFAGIVALGLCLIVPPLYALQKAVSLVSALTISIITALGPFVIFLMQIGEGRVGYAPATLLGLAIYFAGATLAALGAMRSAAERK